MDNVEGLKKYIEQTTKLYGVSGADIHLWLESQPRHSDLTWSEAMKLRQKIISKFGDIYGETLSWAIAFTHFLIDFDSSQKQVMILEKQGDTLVPTIKTIKELQLEVQKVLRKANENASTET